MYFRDANVALIVFDVSNKKTLESVEYWAREVKQSNADDFFTRNGLLYESIPELQRITDRVAAAQPLMAYIATDPTLRAFADVQGVWRYPIRPEQVSPLYLQALLNYVQTYYLSEAAKDRGLLEHALTHKSKAHEDPSGGVTDFIQTDVSHPITSLHVRKNKIVFLLGTVHHDIYNVISLSGADGYFWFPNETSLAVFSCGKNNLGWT